MPPAFFVPAATPEDQESVYADFAKLCHCPAPNLEYRVYSITFSNDGETWTATVGESLRGTKVRLMRRRGNKVEQSISLGDPATVLAIFPGVPYQVVTNEGIGRRVGSRFANPFLAGEPSDVVLFAPMSEGTGN